MPRLKQKLNPRIAQPQKTAQRDDELRPKSSESASSAQQTEDTNGVADGAHPESEFAQDFYAENDRDFAHRHEEALAMESDLEAEMRDGREEETWQSALKAFTRGAAPLSTNPEEMFVSASVSTKLMEALNTQDPYEAMLDSQCVTMQMHFYNCMRKAGRTLDPDVAQTYINLALRLSAAQQKVLEMLNRLRNKGQQKIVVEKVTIDDGRQKSEGHRVTVSGDNVDARRIPSAESLPTLDDHLRKSDDMDLVEANKARNNASK
jgi:hypothetical protein